MTEQQLSVARQYINWHTDRFGFSTSNVKFIEGYIELLGDYGIEKRSLDVVVSNCVINLCFDKKKVFQEVYQVLKNGGEFYFSDVYCSRRVPTKLKDNKVLWGECLSGALYWNDFENLVRECGFVDPRVVNFNQITINNKELEKPPSFFHGLPVHPTNPKAWAMVSVGFSNYTNPNESLLISTLILATIFIIIQFIFHNLWCFFGVQLKKIFQNTKYEIWLMRFLSLLMLGSLVLLFLK